MLISWLWRRCERRVFFFCTPLSKLLWLYSLAVAPRKIRPPSDERVKLKTVWTFYFQFSAILHCHADVSSRCTDWNYESAAWLDHRCQLPSLSANFLTIRQQPPIYSSNDKFRTFCSSFRSAVAGHVCSAFIYNEADNLAFPAPRLWTTFAFPHDGYE